MFGWRRSDGTRRYRSVYIEVPKGNGKTPLAAAIALLLLFGDGEPGAEVYFGAGDRKQACQAFTDARNMILQSDALMRRSIVHTYRMVNTVANGFAEPLSSNAPTKHGFRPHGLIFDELHVFPNRDFYDTLRLGMIKRRQPLIVMITTAGQFDEESLGWQEHEYALAVLKSRTPRSEWTEAMSTVEAIDDPYHYAVIYAADREDDWTSPRIWKKANPSFGVTIQPSEFARIVKKAKHNPVEQATVKQLHLNIWQDTLVGGIDMDLWRACSAEPVCEGPCFLGLDLSSKLDLTAVAAYWPETHSVVVKFWIPEANVAERSRREIFDYRGAIKDGLIETTPGSWIDQAAIRRYVNELGEKYDVQEIGFDSWNASQMSTWLQDDDGFQIVEMRQGAKTMSEPSKFLVGLIRDARLRHGGNAVLRWNARNLMFRRDPNDGWAPKKHPQGRKRIDGMVALIMAIGRSLVARDDGDIRITVA